jgi:1-acyl-sn-glycerol-3-phosphate acyltransferase
MYFYFLLLLLKLQALSLKLQARKPGLQLAACGLQLFSLSLSLLKAGILFVDHVKSPFAAHDFAICASFFDGCSYFHVIFFGPWIRASNCELRASRFDS